jgi:hypothetical protein
MKPQKIKIYCHEKDCINFKYIEWSGGYIDRFFCHEHAFRLMPSERNKQYASAKCEK